MTGGLRERNRAAAMRRIQTVALDLFDAEGFDAVTIERIAEAAEVSPSSVYRYFGTKERLVLWDEWDPRLSELFLGADDGALLDGLRRAIRSVVGGLGEEGEARIRRRMRLMMATPAVEAAAAGHTYAASEVLGEALAAHLGRAAVDLEVQIFAHASVGSLLGALHHWHGTGFAEPLGEVLERSVDILASGAGGAIGANGAGCAESGDGASGPRGAAR